MTRPPSHSCSGHGWLDKEHRGGISETGPAHPVCPRAKGRTHPEERRPSGTALPGPGCTTVAFLCSGGDGPWERPVRVLRSSLWVEVRHFWQILCCPEASKHINNTGSALLDLGEGPGLPVPPAEGMCLSAWSRWVSGSEGGAGLGRRRCAEWSAATLEACVCSSLRHLRLLGTVPAHEQEGTSWEGGMWDLVCRRTSGRWLRLAA